MSKKLIREDWDDTPMEVYLRRGLAEVLGVAPSFFPDDVYQKMLVKVSRPAFELSVGAAYLQQLLIDNAYGAHYRNRLKAICTFLSAIEQIEDEDNGEDSDRTGGTERSGQDDTGTGTEGSVGGASGQRVDTDPKSSPTDKGLPAGTGSGTKRPGVQKVGSVAK